MQQYEGYSSEQLAMDSGFQNWVLHPTHEDDQAWRAFLERYPHRRTTVEEAISLVRHAGLTADSSQNQAYLEGWNRLTNEINATSSRNRWMRYAASLVLLAIAGSGIYFTAFRKTVEKYETAFGETQEVSLSDGSRVVLDANATLIVDAIADNGRSRLVTLEGDAYFDVKHTSSTQPFIIRASNNVEVHVVGTSFDVRQHNNSVEVLLKTGIVKMVAGGKAETLTPGQLATASANGISISTPGHDVAADRLSWLDGLFVMNDKSLTEVADYITEHFGKAVVLNGDDLKALTVSGKVPANELPVLLEVLKQTLRLSIEEKDGTLYIRSDIK